MRDSSDVWFKRFTMIVLFNGFLAIAWTVPVLLSGEFGLPDLSIAKTIAGGSVGTWGFIGYIIWLIVGIGIIFLSAVAYYIIPKALNSSIYSDKLSFAHLALLEIGTLGTAVLLAWTGYVGGTMLLNSGPSPATFASIHESIVGYVAPIMVFVFIGILGGLAGLINILMTLLNRKAASK